MPTVLHQTVQTIPLHQQRDRFRALLLQQWSTLPVKPGKRYPWLTHWLLVPGQAFGDWGGGLGRGVEPASCIASRAIAAARSIVTISTIPQAAVRRFDARGVVSEWAQSQAWRRRPGCDQPCLQQQSQSSAGIKPLSSTFGTEDSSWRSRWSEVAPCWCTSINPPQATR